MDKSLTDLIQPSKDDIIENQKRNKRIKKRQRKTTTRSSKWTTISSNGISHTLIMARINFNLVELREKPKKRKGRHAKRPNKRSTFKNTTDKVVSIDDIVKELPELLVKHAYTKLKSGEELTASEMKVCLEVCKTYSTDNLNKKTDNILDDVPFDTNG